jgi:hypothetical protein
VGVRRGSRGRVKQLTPLDRVKRLGPALEKWAYLSGLRSPRGLPLPHFLGIGAQKAGTTWLDRNLRCHPDLFLPEQKELHYFDRQWFRGLHHYLRKFEGSGGRVRGEITPSYSVLRPERIRYIHTLMPHARLVLLLRNPVDRAWSHSMMRLVKRRKCRLEDVDPEELLAHLREGGNRRRSSYLTVLDHWLRFYPQEQLFIGFFEEVGREPQELLARIFRHLEVREDVEWEQFPYNQVIGSGVGARMPGEYRALLERLYAEELEGLHARFGERVAHWLPGAESGVGARG